MFLSLFLSNSVKLAPYYSEEIPKHYTFMFMYWTYMYRYIIVCNCCTMILQKYQIISQNNIEYSCFHFSKPLFVLLSHYFLLWGQDPGCNFIACEIFLLHCYPVPACLDPNHCFTHRIHKHDTFAHMQEREEWLADIYSNNHMYYHWGCESTKCFMHTVLKLSLDPVTCRGIIQEML